jgi:hypothetical protein
MYMYIYVSSLPHRNFEMCDYVMVSFLNRKHAVPLGAWGGYTLLD